MRYKYKIPAGKILLSRIDGNQSFGRLWEIFEAYHKDVEKQALITD